MLISGSRRTPSQEPWGGSGCAASLTNGIRFELAEQGTLVTGLMLSATDTDMMAGWDIPKNDPADVVRAALDGIEAGRLEVIADADTAATKADMARDPSDVYALPA